MLLALAERLRKRGGREAEDYTKFRSEAPFAAYCETKCEAELLIYKSVARCVMARVGPMYGEGDNCSLICDSILLSRHRSQIPRIGDQSGVIQFTYAGNVAHALLKVASELYSKPDMKDEIVLIADSTPNLNIYDQLLLPIFEDDNSGENAETNSSAFINKISTSRTSFYVAYPLYLMLAMVGHIFRFCLGTKNPLAKLPHPDYLYMALHHWTFFSDFKLRIFYGHTPRYDHKTCLERSKHYYRQLKPEQIVKYSWLP